METERARRPAIASSRLEVSGRISFDAPQGPFLLTGKADRIDVLNDGAAAILDYKTGGLPDKKWMVSFLTPQLPLEGAMLAKGGFDGLPVLVARELIYMRLCGGTRGGEERVFDGSMAPEAAARLAQRIAWFDAGDYALSLPRGAPERQNFGRLRSSGAGAGMGAGRLDGRAMSDPSIRASDPTRSAWVAANAGSGKTYTLANRVTRLLLGGARPERILCLTFTKAAAAEMQHRLFRQLGRWSMLADDELTKAIAGIGGEAGDLAKARRLFAQALETPGGLKFLPFMRSARSCWRVFLSRRACHRASRCWMRIRPAG